LKIDVCSDENRQRIIKIVNYQLSIINYFVTLHPETCFG